MRLAGCSLQVPVCWRTDCIGGDIGRADTEQLEVLGRSLDLGDLRRAELRFVEGAFGLANHVNPISAVLVLLDDCPVRVVRADRRVNLELVGQFHEELHVLARIELLCEHPLRSLGTFRIDLNVVEVGLAVGERFRFVDTVHEQIALLGAVSLQLAELIDIAADLLVLDSALNRRSDNIEKYALDHRDEVVRVADEFAQLA